MAPFIDISITTMVTGQTHPLPAAVINLPEGSCQEKQSYLSSKNVICHCCETFAKSLEGLLDSQAPSWDSQHRGPVGYLLICYLNLPDARL